MNAFQQVCEDYIKKKSSEYGSKNKFLASEEYKKEYPELRRRYLEYLKELSIKGKKAMESVGAKERQRVYYDVVGLWGHVERQEGIIKLDKYGIPCVKLDSGHMVGWHKGFKEIK